MSSYGYGGMNYMKEHVGLWILPVYGYCRFMDTADIDGHKNEKDAQFDHK